MVHFAKSVRQFCDVTNYENLRLVHSYTPKIIIKNNNKIIRLKKRIKSKKHKNNSLKLAKVKMENAYLNFPMAKTVGVTCDVTEFGLYGAYESGTSFSLCKILGKYQFFFNSRRPKDGADRRLFSVVTGYPFDTVKVRQQNFSTSMLIAIRETFKYEGVLGFYKGMMSPLIMYGPSNSIFFGCTSKCMQFINGSSPDSPSSQNQRDKYLTNLFYAGSVGGFFQATLMCPVELIKIALQTSTDGQYVWVHNMNTIRYEGTKHTFKTIVKLKGWRGLYKGFIPMLIRDVPTSGVYFVVYEILLPPNKNDVYWFHQIWAGGWAGIASISTVLPVDVIKTRMQADDLLRPNYNGMMECGKKLYIEEGFRIFWKGLPIITARAFPAHAMLFIGYEMTIDRIKTRSD